MTLLYGFSQCQPTSRQFSCKPSMQCVPCDVVWRKCIPLMLVYLSTTYTLYELLMMNLSVHKRSANGKAPVSLSVLCKIRYQQPADNVYRVLQHAVITFFNVSRAFHIPARVPFHIPFYSFYSFPTTLLACMQTQSDRNYTSAVPQ